MKYLHYQSYVGILEGRNRPTVHVLPIIRAKLCVVSYILLSLVINSLHLSKVTLLCKVPCLRGGIKRVI